MKHLLSLITMAALASCGTLARAQSGARNVTKSSTTHELTEPLKTGAKTLTVSAAGTLQWESGATLGNASLFRASAGLTIGTNVQAYDADLTTYAGITPSANVQSLLGAADYAAMRTSLGLVIGTHVQAHDADLTTYAGITPSEDVQFLLQAEDMADVRDLLSLVPGANVQAYDGDLASIAALTTTSYGRSLLTLANAAALRTTGGLVIGTDVQGYDADLSIYASITPSADVQAFLAQANKTNMRASLGLIIGTNVQPYDADLVTYAGITPSADVQTLLGAADNAAMRTALGVSAIGGSSGQFQFNNSGVLGGASGLQYNSANGRVMVNTSTAQAAALTIATTVGGDDALILRDTTNSANARLYFSAPVGSPPDLHVDVNRLYLDAPGGVYANAINANDGTLDLGSNQAVLMQYVGRFTVQTNVANTVVYDAGYNIDTVIRPYAGKVLSLSPDGDPTTVGGTVTISAGDGDPLKVQNAGTDRFKISTTATAGNLWVGHLDYHAYELAGNAWIYKYDDGERCRLVFGEDAHSGLFRAGTTGNAGFFTANSDHSAAYLAGDIRLISTVGNFTIEPRARDAAGGYTGAGHEMHVNGGAGQAASTGGAGGAVRLSGGNAGGSGDNDGGDVWLRGGTATGSGVKGRIYIDLDSLPTTDPADAGALWRDGDVIKISHP